MCVPQSSSIHDSEWGTIFFRTSRGDLAVNVHRRASYACERKRATTPPRWPSGMRGSPTKHLRDRQRNVERIDFGTLVDVNRPQRALAFF